MTRAVGIVLLVLGLALGPGSHIASRFFSGHLVAAAPLSFTAGNDGLLHARFAFTLPDDALPAAVVIQATASHGPALQPADAPADTWTVRLLKDGSVAREQPMRLQSKLVEATPAQVFKESIPLEVAQGGGDYVLDIALPAQQRLTLDGARVEVRAGITPADPSWLAAGLALIAVALILLLTA